MEHSEWLELKNKPNPGSRDALLLGCTCPSIDNGHGLGYLIGDDRVFVMSGSCPLHGIVGWKSAKLRPASSEE